MAKRTKKNTEIEPKVEPKVPEPKPVEPAPKQTESWAEPTTYVYKRPLRRL